tara:strand:+ start:8545 stop:9399 length:855 start_codon:yes stop_codon:yes gene_type:complete
MEVRENILIPKFHPVTWVCFVVYYFICELYGGDPNPDVALGVILEIAGIITAGAAIYGAISANKRQKEALAQSEAAMALQAEQEAQRRADVQAAFGPQAEDADKRLAEGDYGFDLAREREIDEETNRAIQAAQKTALAELDRGGEGRVFSGFQEDAKRDISKAGADEAAKARLASTRFSEELAENQRQRDIGIKQNYAALLSGLPPSQLPGMMQSQAAMLAGMPTAAERFGQLGMQGLQAAATLGAFDKKTPEAPNTNTAIDAAAGADPGAPAATTAMPATGTA